MQLEQRFDLPASAERSWAAFHDVQLLVDCLPGAALTGPAVDGLWPLRFDVKLGPIAVSFVGSGRVAFDEAARTGRFEGSAADGRTQSRVKGAASFRVDAEGDASTVTVGIDYTLTGALAQFSRGGIVRELANALTAQFAARLATRLPQEADADPVTVAADPATLPGDGPLDAGSLVGHALRARWRKWVD